MKNRQPYNRPGKSPKNVRTAALVDKIFEEGEG